MRDQKTCKIPDGAVRREAGEVLVFLRTKRRRDLARRPQAADGLRVLRAELQGTLALARLDDTPLEHVPQYLGCSVLAFDCTERFVAAEERRRAVQVAIAR